MYFLKITGVIPRNKFRELEHSFNVLNLDILPNCIEYKLYQEINEPECIHFFSLWTDKDSIEQFMCNQSYHFLNGIFKTLGNEKVVEHGIYEIVPVDDSLSNSKL